MPLDAYIVDCVRTPGGKNKGVLSRYHPADLGTLVLDEVVRRSGVPPAAVDDVIVGCVSQFGAQSCNIARTMVCGSKLVPDTVPGTTVDRQCGSSQQAIHFAAQAVMSGTQDCVVAAGVEVMSLLPIGCTVSDALKTKRGNPYASKGFQENNVGDDGRFAMPSQFKGAETLVHKYDLNREELDRFAAASHQRAAAATRAGHFKREVLPVPGVTRAGETVVVRADEGIREGTTYEKLSTLKPLDSDGGGVITAGTSSQITDGASAVMVCNERAVKKYGLKPRARIVQLSLAGTDPMVVLEGPIPASQHALRSSGLSIKDIDLYEVNEAFASVPVAWMKALGAEHSRLNVSGGACALGHPLGASGARLMTTLVNNLERTGGRYGLEAICEGGGTANCTIIERCSAVRNPKL